MTTHSVSSPLRVLLIGCGGIVNSHLPAFEKYPDRLRLVAGCDPVAAATAKVADRMKAFGPVTTFSEVETAIAAMRGKVDAAIVTTPHFLHYPNAKACVEMGIPVLIEKPVCNNLEETRKLLELSEKHHTLVVAGQNRRYEAKALWARKWLAENPKNFGSLRSFDLRGWQNIEAWVATKLDKNADFWIFDKKRAGGGVVVSLLVHYIDMVRHITGLNFVEASAKGRCDAPFKNGAESSCCALLTLSNGAVGTLHANYLARKCFEPNEIFNLLGENGYIGNERGWQYASTHGQEPTGWEWQFEGMTEIPEDNSLVPDPSSFVCQLLAFADAVRSGSKPMSHIAENINTMATMEAIYESMQNGGKAVKIETV